MTRIITLAAALIGVAALVLGIRFTAGAGEQTAEYWFPSDPSLELIRLEFFGGMLGQQSRYSVTADGTLAIRRTTRPDLDIALTPEQLDGLVRLAVDGGMASVTEARQQNLRDMARRYVNSDSGAVRLTFHLPHFQAPDETTDQPVDGQLTLMKLGTYASHFAEEPEVACILAISAELRTLESTHRKMVAP